MKTTLKKSVAHAVFNSSDLGGKSIEKAIECTRKNVPYAGDHLTAFLVDSINECDKLEDLEASLNYAIDVLKKAKNAALHNELVIN